MKLTSLSHRQHEVLQHLHQLPYKILQHHEHDHLPDLVLQELCSALCFNMKKAAYFVDNPDFDCSRGVSGFIADEQYGELDNAWHAPVTFGNHVKSSTFNKKVRELQYPSITKNNTEFVIERLARELGIEQPEFCTWCAKHANNGVVIYERALDPEVQEYLNHGFSLLGFCPAF